MKILVTGASGYIGACLVRKLLAAGHQVSALARHARNAESLQNLDIERIDQDIRDLEGLRRSVVDYDIVYHLAAKISITGQQKGEVWSTNVEGTRHVAIVSQERQVKRLVYVSSIHAYQHKPFCETLDESRQMVSPHASKLPAYDRSKAVSEQVLRPFIEQGLDVVIIQPTGVLGPYDFGTSLTNKALLMMFQKKIPALVNGGFNWVDVRDVVATLSNAAVCGYAGERYIVGGYWHSVRSLAQMVANTMQVSVPKITVPLRLAKWMAPLVMQVDKLLGREILFTRDSVSALNSNQHIDYSKASQVLNHQPRQIAQSIADLHRWLVRRGELSCQ